MSAFVVEPTHVDALVSAGLSWRIGCSDLRWFWPELDRSEDMDALRGKTRELTFDSAGRVASMLYTECYVSVRYRYDSPAHEEMPGLIDMPRPDEYVFAIMNGTPDPVVVLKALSCYEYQACEHPGWLSSEARQFCDALRHRAIRALPGYDAAPWEIHDRQVFSPYRKAAA